jgi:1-acyl-sn-glycerol-3-phosphate acyltransferase
MLSRIAWAALSRWYRGQGWRTEGVLSAPKMVLIAAPHTSNWDFPFTLAAAADLGVRINWMGKDSLFRWPFGGLMRRLGGVPVDRRKSNNMVDQMVAAFAACDTMYLVVPPEGTRGKVRRWKTGFYHIALGASVPIALGFVDYRRKVAGVGPTLMPSGDLDADMATIKAFYATVTAKYPHMAVWED